MKKVFTLLLLLFCAVTGWASVDPTPTTTIEDGTYIIKVISDKSANGSYVFLNGNYATADANSDTKNFEGKVTPFADIYKKYLWTIHKNTDGTITITSAYDSSKSFPTTTSTPQAFALSSSAGNYTLVEAETQYANCFYLQVNSSYYIHANGSAGSTNNLGFWQSKGTSAAKACFYKATLDDNIPITYNLTHNGQTLKTVTTNWPADFAYPEISLPDYVTATYPEGKVSEAVTKDVPVAWDNLPVTIGQWCYIKLGLVTTTAQNGYFYDKNDNATRIETGVNTKDITSNNYLWKFVGDPFNGFTIQSAHGHKLVTPAVTGNGGSTFPYAAASAPTNGSDTWVIYSTSDNTINSANGFFLAVKDHPTWKLNSRTITGTNQNALSFWTEGVGTGSAITIENTLPEISLNSLNGTNYATYYLPFAAKAPEGVTAYAGTINGSNVQLTEYANGVIPANKGVLLMSDTKTTATFTLADESDVTTQDNELTGVLTTTELSSVTNHDQVRIFSKKNEVAGFYAPNSNITTLAANKAYIMAPAGTQALTLNFGGGDVTNINTVINTTEDANAPIYDLTGRRVTKAFKGIYIKNGKKFIK